MCGALTMLLSIEACTGEGPRSNSDGQSGTEGSQDVCHMAVSQQAIGPEELVGGQSASQLVRQVRGENELPVSWTNQHQPLRDGPYTRDTVGRFELTPDPTSARRVDYGPNCGAVLELTATLSFRTADDSFVGTVSGTVRGFSSEAAFDADPSDEQVHGGFDSTPRAAELKGLPLKLFAGWSADTPRVSPAHAFPMTSFDLRRGIADIAWRTDARDAGADASPAGDASASSMPASGGLDAGTPP